MKVRFRMYRQGLGDCFLLSFGADKHAKHMLVDCGVILGTANAEQMMSDVVKHIAKTTDGHLDFVVATHEHWDHISGFVQAQSQFNDIELGETWFAWTEAPGDDQADRMRAERAERKARLQLAMTALAAAGLDAPADLTRSLLQFFGEGAVGVAGGKTTADALKYLHGRKAKSRYLEPGTSFSLPGVAGVRVYVLGPPRDEGMIRKGRPSKRDPETYAEPAAALSVQSAFLAAMRGAPAAGAAENDLIFPFDALYRIPVDEAKNRQDDFFRRRYGFDDADTPAAPKWRRIDGDWLALAGELAIQLDNDTNNTSLVLAIELEPGGDVILLPADAQVGNWLSWQDMTFRVRDGDDSRTVTTKDLLARTVLYKVGHHASHNATLRQLGLERMTHEGLIACIPVDESMAETKKWTMPFPPLYDRLRERCSGRVLRIDNGVPDAGQLRRLSTPERDEFAKRTDQKDLYIDVMVGA